MTSKFTQLLFLADHDIMYSMTHLAWQRYNLEIEIWIIPKWQKCTNWFTIFPWKLPQCKWTV